MRTYKELYDSLLIEHQKLESNIMEKKALRPFPTLRSCEEYIRGGLSDKILTAYGEHVVGSLWAYIESCLKDEVKPVYENRRDFSEEYFPEINCDLCVGSSIDNCFECGANQKFINFKTS